ncbi:MAG: hypothetical protein JWP87_436, partial [Labilithrix sp.]|nr:hypothetical protein [Labilithrix sp.]
MSALRHLVLVACVGVAATGCVQTSSSARVGAAHRDRDQSNADAPTCNALGPLVDLRRAMVSSPTSEASPLYALVDAEEELAYARTAAQRLGTPTSSPVQTSVNELVALLEAMTVELRRATENARESFASAEGSLHRASTCRGFVLSELSKQQDRL